MKSLRVHEHGGTEKIVIDEIPEPAPKANEAVVKIAATSVNHLDIWVRGGMRNISLPLPMVLGSDGAGIVAEVGSDITDLRVGDRVLISPGTSCGRCEECLSGHDNLCREYKILGEHCDGTDAELVAARRDNIVKLPDGMSFNDAAASSLVFITAYQMLVEKAKVQPLEEVLVMGASSGVGTAAIQIAKLHNARVIAVAGSPEKLEKAKALGADEVINYSTEKISDGVRRLTGKRGVDVVFEHTGQATWSDSILSANRGGRIVTCGATTGPEAVTDLRYVFYGSTMGSKSLLFTMLDLMSRKKFKAVIDRKMPFTEVRKAHEIIEARKHFGKIVLTY
ncbi:MAG TPA: zinc-binding dehydrogenase [Candidatus Kryptobacter bacterium]|nr:zinc-binding dehydrogenase [Candidatus Kryptobacter bacterium]